MLDKYTIKLLEKKAHTDLSVPAGCQILMLCMGEEKNQHGESLALGLNTIKRLMGFDSTVSDPRLKTKQNIAHYLGFSCWKELRRYVERETLKDAMTDNSNGGYSTYAIEGIMTSSLMVGTLVRYKYKERRELELRYKGDDIFIVQKSINSSMVVGDEYKISSFLKYQPLYAFNVTTGTPYQAGLIGGIYDIEKVDAEPC